MGKGTCATSEEDMSMKKIYSKADQIGEEGQLLVGLTVTRLGHIWHSQRIDYGIDGQIELVDPHGRSASNVYVMVQSKATAGRFPGETEESFHFLLRSSDVGYWRGGSNKVIIVCSRPKDDDIWWAPVDRAEPPATGRRSWRLDFDKEFDRLDENSVGRLLSWAMDSTSKTAVSGRRHQAEMLDTNLLVIKELPQEIFFGPTWKRSARQLGPALRSGGYFRRDWIVRGGVVYSFARPTTCGLRDYLDGGYETIDTGEWAESKDINVRSNFTDLLRQAVLQQEHRTIWYHGKKRLFVFKGPRDNRDELKLKVAQGKPGRTVFKRYYKDVEGTQPKDCRQYAAGLRFVQTDEGWAVESNPTYYFTFDGYRELHWGDDRVKGMKKIEKNLAVRGLVLFWADFLTRHPALGDPRRLIRFDDLIKLQVGTGIDDRDWSPTNDEVFADFSDSGQEALLPRVGPAASHLSCADSSNCPGWLDGPPKYYGGSPWRESLLSKSSVSAIPSVPAPSRGPAWGVTGPRARRNPRSRVRGRHSPCCRQRWE